MSVIGSNILAGASGQGGHFLDNSLRFNASQSSYLSWTPASAGSQKTWTWSCWVKRGTLGAATTMFSVDAATGGDRLQLLFTSTDTIQLLDQLSGGNNILLETTQVFRDPSAWYHVVALVDTTQATSTDRVKIYINGTQVTSLTASTYPTQNNNTWASAVKLHAIGARAYAAGTVNLYHDGYITEVNFIDGQALDPSSFGETDAVTGVWKPKKYVGTYGTNGFYLPMKLDNTVEGFNTVTYIGNGSKQQIRGVGFSPDLVWMKSRTSGTDNHYLANSVSGVQKALFSNLTNAEATDSNGLLSFDTDGFTIGTQGQINTNTVSHVAWCWDAGNSTVSNSDGSITSSVRANPTYGFSVVTFTTPSTNTTSTLGHGLSSAPSLIIVKSRSTTSSWYTYHASLGATKALFLNNTNAEDTSQKYWNNTAPTSSVFTIMQTGVAWWDLNATHVAYCFAEVSGYSKFGSYTGNGSTTGPVITTGFAPAFVLIKESSGAGNNWVIYDNTRDVSNERDSIIYPNLSNAEFSGTTVNLDFLSNGFQPKDNWGAINSSGATYIYMAFKDTREYAYWLDDSGNNNDWQPNGGITTQSSVTDVPTLTSETAANYATLNPLASPGVGAFTQGNLTFTASTSAWQSAISTVGATSGKWYFEATATAITGSNLVFVGAAKDPFTNYSNYLGSDANTWGVQYGNGSPASIYKYNNGSGSAITTGSIVAGDIIQCAIDLDNGYIWFGKNNTWAEGDPAAGTGASFTNLTGSVHFGVSSVSTGNKLGCNFGQQPFAYTPPTGFKALNTYNLPDSTVADGSDYFNTVLYTGNGSSNHSITGVGFQPDFTWLKGRSTTGVHGLWDAVRGATKYLVSNNTDAQVTDTTNGLQTFQSDGFTLGSVGTWNTSSASYVAWNWKANGSGSSNTDGSITSTVSANTTAGFSIVTYTGTGANATVGHGLGIAPSMVIVRGRLINYGGGIGGDWIVWHNALSATERLYLNYTNATATGQTTTWNSTLPSASVVSLGNNLHVNYDSSSTYVMYCFAEVEGFSKIGSYTGNGSTNGPFVYTGFRPAFVMVKKTDTIENWYVHDAVRDTYNQVNIVLYPNLSNAEGSNNANMDFTANGFKMRETGTSSNGSGGTYIYLAFAENPFKNSLAR